MKRTHAAIVMLALGALTACEMRQGPDRRAPVAVQQGAPVGAEPYARPLAHRHEAQDELDSARVAIAMRDTATAIRLLHRSAAFLVIQATEPQTSGTYELLSAADGLDALAGDIRRGSTPDASRLARQSALVNLAEAERHEALAEVAWATRSDESVADELLMAADHYERAARDAGQAPTDAAVQVLNEMRAVARTLASRRDVDVQSLDEPMAAFHLEVRALQRRVRAAR